MSRFIITALLAASTQCSWAQAQITAVVNAASFQSGLPSGGSLATIFCTGLTNVAAGAYVASSSPLPYVLGGLSVVVNNGPAPLLAVVIASSGNAQINFQVPLERNASLLPIQAQPAYPGSLLACGTNMTAFPAPSGWGGFFADANGYAIAQHTADYSLVTPQNPARPGEAVIAYADDFFPVWPPTPVGFPTPQQPLFEAPTIQNQSFLFPFVSTFYVERSGTYLYLQAYPQPICLIGGGCNNSFTDTPALQVTFEGLAPGQIGVEQINFVVPPNQQPGDWPLFFNLGSCPDGGDFNRCAPPTGGLSSPYVKLPVR